MPPAARVGDQHACPSHTGGPVLAGSATVKIGGQPAARVGDQSSCGGARDTIVQGASSVFIDGRPAARAGDRCAHSGVVVTGEKTVVIGNVASADGTTPGGTGGAKDGLTLENDGKSTPITISGTPVQSKVVTALVGLARQMGAMGGAASSGMLGAIATALEVALARGDTAAIALGIGKLQQVMAPKGPDGEAGAEAAPEAGGVTALPGATSAPPSAPQEMVRSVAVADGRLTVNGRFTGLHAISEFDLISLQAEGRIDTVVQRVLAASAAGRNCVRVFCMYANQYGRREPFSTPGYWTAVDAVVKRLIAHGLFGEFVLLADGDVRADGSGGVMPSWTDRMAFTREAGKFFKGKPVIVCGMHEAPADEATRRRLAEAMQGFREASGDTIPFALADTLFNRSDDPQAVAAAQRLLVDTGASIAAAHTSASRGDPDRYREWLDALWHVRAVRDSNEARAVYPYFTQSIEFGAAGEREKDPDVAVAASAICAVGQQGFCYHHVAADDRATPGLDLCRVATTIPQSPDFIPFSPGDRGAPIARVQAQDFAGGGVRGCANRTEVWAVGYGKKLPRSPRVEWRGVTPEVIWRGERAIIWRGDLK